MTLALLFATPGSPAHRSIYHSEAYGHRYINARPREVNGIEGVATGIKESPAINCAFSGVISR